MYQCAHCMENSVVWETDFTLDDFGIEGEGIVQIFRCGSCGAEIQYIIQDED